MPRKPRLPTLFDGQLTEGFDAFWKAYPRKVGKGAARKAYIKVMDLRHATHDVVMNAVLRYIPLWERMEQRFIPHPATWLNQERWEDDIDGEGSNDGPRQSRIGLTPDWRGDDRQDSLRRHFALTRQTADGGFD
jgi:hypothetical protein